MTVQMLPERAFTITMSQRKWIHSYEGLLGVSHVGMFTSATAEKSDSGESGSMHVWVTGLPSHLSDVLSWCPAEGSGSEGEMKARFNQRLTAGPLTSDLRPPTTWPRPAALAALTADSKGRWSVTGGAWRRPEGSTEAPGHMGGGCDGSLLGRARPLRCITDGPAPESPSQILTKTLISSSSVFLPYKGLSSSPSIQNQFSVLFITWAQYDKWHLRKSVAIMSVSKYINNITLCD